MINAVTMLGGGMWVQRKLGEIALPTISRPVDDEGSFKLSVHVHAASVPGLADPSLLTRERPRIEVVLGQARKETELGDYRDTTARSCEDAEPAGRFGTPSLSACPWQFGDTLTFTATKNDILGPGAQVWLRTQGEMRFGTLFQMNMSSTTDVGVCSVDLRRRVLPACVQKSMPGADAAGGAGGEHLVLWETPVMVLPLTHIGGRGAGAASERSFVIGEAVGHVALSFAVNADPEMLLQSATMATMPLHVRAVQPLRDWTVRVGDGVATAAQQITNENVAYAAGVAKEWSAKTATVAVTGVQWVIENSDIEGCSVKTRDRAQRFLEDVGDPSCGGPKLKLTCEGMPSASPSSSSTTPVVAAHKVGHVHLSPAGSTMTRTTATGQSPMSLRVPSVSSGQPSFSMTNTPIKVPDRHLDDGVIPEKAVDSASRVVASSATTSSPGMPKAAALASATAVYAKPAAAATYAPVARVSSSATAPSGAAPKRQVAPSTQPAVVHYTQQAQSGLPPSRSSFVLQPSRQSFQVVRVAPHGGGLPPSRQSFQVVQPAPVVRAPQYVRPGTT